MVERGRATDAGAVHIESQFRTREGMAYELRGAGARLTVLVTKEGLPEVDPWRVEVFTSLAPAETLARRGGTRREALERAGVAWTTEAGERGLPSFDWDAVAQCLATVRAI